MLIGNNIALVIYGFHGWPIDGVGRFLVISFLIYWICWFKRSYRLLLFSTAEFLPKVFFQIYANSLIKVFAIPAYGFICCFISSLLFYLGFWFYFEKFFRTAGQCSCILAVELGNYITEQMSSVEDNEEVDSEKCFKIRILRGKS
jgi:hypothetical protein